MKAAWVFIFAATLIWSGIEPKDRFTWFLEVCPAIIGVWVLWKTYHGFRLTGLLYLLILLHCIVLIIGGHYTYAEVPLFDNISSFMGWERNNYDKVGHFMQGFVPAIIAREILIRKAIVPSDGWRNFFIICICLAFSAVFELFEWLVAEATGESAEAFLGTQGYKWDTQTDIAMCFLGAMAALLFLSKAHDRSLNKLEKSA